ncbi:hypothetical protein LC612_36540 [Nostoc sp. CHAB 5834]|nr:hypothetical protein [Nostoc sp. CHAB 5834]
MRESVIYQSIKAEGRQEGSDKKARKIAINLLAEAISVDVIARVTGLPVEVVQQLQQGESENQK